MILNSYVDPKSGALRRTDAELRDAAVLVGLVLKGRQWLDTRILPAADAAEDSPTQVEVLLQEGRTIRVPFPDTLFHRAREWSTRTTQCCAR
jgi:hypothetical protein